MAGVVAAAALGVSAASASANDVWLWACHGPNGEAIPSAQLAHVSGTAVKANALGGGCADTTAAGPAGYTLSGAGSPADGDRAGVTITLPGALNAKAVKVNRTLRGFDAAPGYALKLNGKALAAGDAGTPIAIDPAGTVTLELSCSSTCSGTPSADIVSVALLVTDTQKPSGGVNRNTPVDKGMPMLPSAMDSGVGLDYAVVSVDGYPHLTQQRKFGTVGQPTCDELSPGNATNDRPLDTNRCRTNTTTTFMRPNPDFPEKSPIQFLTDPIVIDSLQLPEGTHKRNVTIYDAAGNGYAAIVGEEFEVWHPPAPVAERTLNISTASVTEPPTLNPNPPGRGGVQSAQRNQCRTPRLSVILRSKPVRVSKRVPVLKYKKRYRFTGRLTCVINGKRQSAPKRTKVNIFNKVGKKTVRKPNTAIRAKGKVDLKLAFASSRTVIFRYRNADGQRSEVKIKVRITKKKS